MRVRPLGAVAARVGIFRGWGNRARVLFDLPKDKVLVKRLMC